MRNQSIIVKWLAERGCFGVFSQGIGAARLEYLNQGGVIVSRSPL
ncbi:hypothetical protein [Acidocella aromatica]|uniref:Uncharacterized protein n=1 Tax=Acidocella aromatica TaxID=1303579 RepID=A0A840V840_9PROT|nr:hypothetical protein [Acidocella aromatica]MBB5371883.1 hypothetical protein [Acidocella aromatica]